MKNDRAFVVLISIAWAVIVGATLWWILATATGCADNIEPPRPDAATGYPWCDDVGCPDILTYDRACGATRVCFCKMQRCEPVIPMQ